MDILKKQFKRIGSENDIIVPKSMDGEFVVLTNGGRIKLMTLMSDFKEVIGIGGNDENIVAPIEENIDANSFFSKELVDPNIKNSLEQIKANPEAEIAQTKTSKDLDVTIQAPNVNNPLLNRLSEESAVKSNRLPEYDLFDRVKCSEEVEFTIKIKIKLPKAQKIDALNDMFETSLISYLASKHVDEMLKNSKDLEETISDNIESWMNKKMGLPDVPKKKKTVKTPVKNTVKKETKKEEVKKEEIVSTNLADRI